MICGWDSEKEAGKKGKSRSFHGKKRVVVEGNTIFPVSPCRSLTFIEGPFCTVPVYCSADPHIETSM